MVTKLNPVEEYQIKAIPKNQGCTACVVLITKNYLYCANAGDSRAILCPNDNAENEIIKLSNDHKPNVEEERILEAGGYVEKGRIQGQIGVSRSIGDWKYKATNTR
jgi:serine/threonine protein phosphatase PrpC